MSRGEADKILGRNRVREELERELPGATAMDPIFRDLANGLMRWHIWRCRMRNGAEFEVKNFFRLSRQHGRAALLKQANGDYGEVIYASRDIESMWEARS